MLIFGILTLTGLVPIPNLLFSIFCLVVGMVFTFGYKGAKLDMKRRRIKEYFGFFGIKFGRWETLPDLTEIVFTSSRYSQQVHAWVSRMQHNTRVYRGFLKGPGGFKQLFVSGGDSEKTVKEITAAAKALNLPAVNYNIRPPQIIS